MRELSPGNDLAKPTALLCSAVIFGVERGGREDVRLAVLSGGPDSLSYVWGWEMAQSGKCFLYKHKDPSSTPRTHMLKAKCGNSCLGILVLQRWRQVDPRAYWPASLDCLVMPRSALADGALEVTPETDLWPPHAFP